ncbi:SDR family oxidoreductase [Brevibacterium album]|uniref:SDR family oxidoreductase n=1 Tax=Brevibacterium album TaxID=417948 RepID=UPI0004150523|nr:SDR family oxidoreductase [Brevibacterium album]
MDLGLRGRTALVCSSTKGLGWASARELASAGARVAVHGRDPEAAAAQAAQLPDAVGIGCDLTTEAGAESLAAQALELLGGVDILVLNGPGPAPGRAAGLSAEEVRAALESLVVAQTTLLQRLLPPMRERGWGRVVAISSTSVEAPIPNLALSNMGRPALISLMKTVASEVAAEGVTLNAVLPGRFDTERVREVNRSTAERAGLSADEVLADSLTTVPARRLGEPEELGAAVAFLASERASFITGTALRVDGGAVPVL